MFETPEIQEESTAAARCQCLADLIVGRPPARPIGGEEEWSELVALAVTEGVAPLLARTLPALPQVDVPAATTQTLELLYSNSVLLSLLYRSVRTRVCQHLSEQSIPVLLLKGAALTLTCYQDPATRPMSDMDVLVPEARLQEAARCLEADGFSPFFLPRSLIPFLNRPHIHLVYTHPVNSAVVELHWEFHLSGSVRRKAVDEIWAAAQPAPGDVPALLMRLGHMVPLACAHMTLQHKQASLLWLYDLHRMLLTMDAEEAVRIPEAATRWKLGPATAHSLLRVQELFGTPLPHELAAWAAETTTRSGGLQARVAALSLTPRAAEMPHSGLLNLAMNCDWRFLRSLFPAPAAVRDHLHLTPGQSVIPGYITLMTRRARQVPAQVRQFRRCWRLTSSSHPPQSTREQGGRQ